MKTILLASLLLTGCQSQVQLGNQQIPVRKLSDAQKISLLRSEAVTRGIHWRIVCMDWKDENEDPNIFLAEAAYIGEPLTLDLDQGSKGLWIEEGRTQAEAAWNLYSSIQGPKTNHAHEGIHIKPRAHRICPPELHSD